MAVEKDGHYCNDQSRVADRRHPDVAWIGPLEKSGAKQPRTMNDGRTAPHHHQALKHKGKRSVGFVRIDCNVQSRPEKADQQSLDKRSHVGRVDAWQYRTFAVPGHAWRLHNSGGNAVSRSFSARTSLILGSLWRATCWPPRVALLKKAVFDLAVNPMKPLLRTISSFLASGEFSFKRGSAIFGSPQLIRKLLRHAKRVATVFVSYAGRLCDQLQNGLACLVELIGARHGTTTISRERNDV
jgi:hypothetical protein